MESNEQKLRTLITPQLSAKKEMSGEVIEYELLVDAEARLHIRMLNNTKKGTFSPHAFSLALLESDLATDAKTFVGVNENGLPVQVGDNNNMAFLRSIVRQLLP